MKTILIATDFSSASRVASLYGVQLAKALNAKIILFNAYKVPHEMPALNLGLSRYDIITQKSSATGQVFFCGKPLIFL